MTSQNPNSPVLLPFAPRASAVQAVQFLGNLDEGSASPSALALAHTSNPARTPDLSLAGTFLGLPVRQEPYRHVQHATVPASVAATLHLAPDNVPAVLVPTPTGGAPAFPGDWIVKDANGIFSVWSDEKFRGGFEATSDEARTALSDGSGTLRYDGSGTGRWGAHGNWTEYGDGTDYPEKGASYGVPQNAPFVPLDEDAPDASIVPASQAFAAAPSSDPLVPGSSFRILRADQSVDPVAHVVKAIDGDLVVYESDGETLEVLRDHVVPVKPAAHDILA